MDANGTRFHLILGKPDWGRCILATRDTMLNDLFEPAPTGCDEARSEFDWDPKKSEITLRSCVFEFRAAAADRRPVLADRRGAAGDRYGNFYWIDDTTREIRVKSPDAALPSTFWPVAVERRADFRKERGEFAPIATPGPSPPVQFSALTVTDDHYLVVGTIEPKGLLIFDLHAGGPPAQMCWPRVVPFAPFDMAPRPGGGVWILDRENLRYWALDRHWNVVADEQSRVTLAPETPDEFQSSDHGPTHSTPARSFPEGIAFDLASPVTATVPVSIEALPDDTVLILGRDPEAGTSAIYRYRFGRQVGPTLPLRDYALVGHDFVLVPDSGAGGARLGLLTLVGDDGNQARTFVLTRDGDALHLELLRDYLPMRLFGGKALIAAGRQIYYDLGPAWIPLVEQHRPRYAREAVLATPRFDGRDPDCVWHRLLLDACIPPTTSVSIESRAANDERDLEQTAWTREPRLYLRNASELPFAREPMTPETDEEPYETVQPVQAPPSSGDRGTWELLFQHARGRFLQLRLTLTGDGRTTPRLRALRAYYPRFSYLEHYLPAVYRDDEQSASFLDRFLANVEGFYTALEDRIAAAQILFDVRSAPPETLEWLASWFGVVLDPSWNEAKRRLFIRHAMDFFQYRGTIRGLVAAARLAIEPCADERIFASTAGSGVVRASGIRIVEKYRTRRTPAVVLGDPTDVTGPRVVPLTGSWRPEQGRATLRKRYTDAVGDATVSEFPIRGPDPPADTAWRQFATDTLGFVPSASSADQSAWRDFLARRYRRVSTLNSAYKLTPPLSAFSDARLPTELPPDGPALQDWYQFESVVLPMRRTAHRFTVLLPRTSASASPASQQKVVDLTRRVIELEKPAGTVFDVKFYWGMFRVGEARLGDDTLIDRGGRAPELMIPFTLGQGHLSGGYLAPGHPFDVRERTVLDGDRRLGEGVEETPR